MPTGESGETPAPTTRGANPEGNALLARFHRGAGTPKAEFAGLMSIAGYASFADACALWDAAPARDSGSNGPAR